jgi:hypothetical protein
MSNYTSIVSDRGDKKDYTSYEKFNEWAVNRTVSVELLNKQKYISRNASICNDSLTFAADSILYHKSKNEVQCVRYTYHIHGLIFGFIDGTLLGGLCGELIGESSHSSSEEKFGGGFAGMIYGCTIGATLGIVYGAVEPPETIFSFDPKEIRVDQKAGNAP